MIEAVTQVVKRKPAFWLLFILLASLISRILTGISYLEDPDSLRFALAVKDFDITRLQPHFPGYPVFVFIVKIFYAITGKLNLSFAITGGLSVFMLTWATINFVNRLGLSLHPVLAVLLVFFNPLFWLMSNRFMPDLMGLSVLVWCLCLYLRKDETEKPAFFFLTGLLTGIRLSYLPFLIIPVVIVLYKNRISFRMLLAGLAGVLIWLVPMTIDAGLQGMIDSALRQAEGHFYDWGGSVITDPGYIDRLYSFISGVFAHGIGLWWPGRSVVTIVSTLLIIFAFVVYKLRGPYSFRLPGWLTASLIGYIIWVFFFQNILFNPRHLMPVVFILLIYFSWILSNTKPVLITLFLLFYSGTTIVLAVQHRQPSAIAQASEELRSLVGPEDQIISTEVVNYYLDMTGIKGTKYDVRRDKPENSGVTYVIGNFSADNSSKVDSTWYYFHNPYVNLIWPTLKVTRIEN